MVEKQTLLHSHFLIFLLTMLRVPVTLQSLGEGNLIVLLKGMHSSSLKNGINLKSPYKHFAEAQNKGQEPGIISKACYYTTILWWNEVPEPARESSFFIWFIDLKTYVRAKRSGIPVLSEGAKPWFNPQYLKI